MLYTKVEIVQQSIHQEPLAQDDETTELPQSCANHLYHVA